jgi:hypothetical protein
MPIDPDPAGIGTYLASAVLLAFGIAIFLYILIEDARANRGQERLRHPPSSARGHPSIPESERAGG